MFIKNNFNVVIVGAGHNGLVASCYLAKAGLKVLVLERNDHAGGATFSSRIFPDFDAKISEYSYLVSLFPKKIIKDLGLDFQTKQRSTASFTPIFQNGKMKSYFIKTGREYPEYKKILELTHAFAKHVWPTMLRPLISKKEMEKGWESFIEQPLGEIIEKSFRDDALRGLVFTDGKIGVFTHPYDPSLLQNRTFLYHVVGNANGEWHVPIHGMGHLADELQKKALKLGVTILTDAPVVKIEPGKQSIETTYRYRDRTIRISSRFVLSNAAPKILYELIDPSYVHQMTDENEGSVLKINMLLQRLPKLSTKEYSPKQAFAGTFHINEGYEAMKKNYEDAKKGLLPKNPAGEMYCHTLTDPSILSKELQKKGYHTLTLFGLDMPYRLFEKNNEKVKQEMLKRYFSGINQFLAEPIENCLAIDKNGNPCVSVKSPVDLENELNMPYGNIFHDPLKWPFAENEDEVGAWGVETKFKNIFLCGAGARRGGGVSGIPGHNAAMEIFKRV